ncbi:MAG: hypothetical protein ACE5NM_00900 [Sedimentisphaerales bacterium]
MRKIHANIQQRTANAKNEYRDRVDLLRSRLYLLSGKDKLMMMMYLEYGNSFRQIARLTGTHDIIVARRIRRLMKGLINGQYVNCLRNRSQFTRTEMAIAKDYFLTGMSMKKIAAKRQLTYYRVREIIKKIQQVISTIELDRRRDGIVNPR